MMFVHLVKFLEALTFLFPLSILIIGVTSLLQFYCLGCSHERMVCKCAHLLFVNHYGLPEIKCFYQLLMGQGTCEFMSFFFFFNFISEKSKFKLYSWMFFFVFSFNADNHWNTLKLYILKLWFSVLYYCKHFQNYTPFRPAMLNIILHPKSLFKAAYFFFFFKQRAFI